MKSRSFLAAVTAVLVLGITSVAVAASVSGAGSTFAAPFWQQVGADFQKKTGNTINYAGVGSGAGIAQLTAGTIDFGGTDAPMNKTEQGKAQAKGVDVIHFPAILGAVTMSYHLSGVKTGVKLTGATIANIYMGKITKWNDRAITKLNKGVKLPNKPITVVHRSDSSGTTFIFTTFLSGWSSAWKSSFGIDKSVKWPVGIGAKGNDGVSAAIKQTDGAIGYPELAYAVQNGFTYAAIKNRAGRYLLPTRAATSAAATGIVTPPTLKINITNSAAKKGYPLAAATWAMVYADPCKAGASSSTASALAAFLKYAVSSAGQKTAKKLLYAPLTKGLQKKTVAKLGKLTCNGSPIK